ncbi:MAG: hypothetical protein JWM95_2685 [Gemmatimonadetes bacterium]|nr:hypothetical protein [Gemmatimonadota bacterium]
MGHVSPVGVGIVSVRDIQRQIAMVLPNARSAGAEGTLELASQHKDEPRIKTATLIEGSLMRAFHVGESDAAHFVAFLDGKQRSHVVSYLGSKTLSVGVAAAVVRERCESRLCTWKSAVCEWRVYAPRILIQDSEWTALSLLYGSSLVDTSADVKTGSAHPFALRDATVKRVNEHRDELERQLAEQWCTTQLQPLFLDGGIRSSRIVAESPWAVGVIKSHNTLYVEGGAFETVMGLGVRERSSVFRIESRTRPAVASWYLRMRNAMNRDPMWGLVRVEVALLAGPKMSRRADDVSRWILAEASPLALPDGRWDKMVYGVRDCEEYLRALGL